jgi:hypothetical protein
MCVTHCLTCEPDQDAEEEEEDEEEQELDAVAELLEAGDGSGEDEEGWAVGETVWVWDTDVPEKDAKEGEETWNVFKARIDKIELGREGGDDHSLKFPR